MGCSNLERLAELTVRLSDVATQNARTDPAFMLKSARIFGGASGSVQAAFPPAFESKRSRRYDAQFINSIKGVREVFATDSFTPHNLAECSLGILDVPEAKASGFRGLSGRGVGTILLW